MVHTDNIKDEDKFYLDTYGMTKAEFEEKYPPLDDGEFMKLYIGSKKFVDNSFRDIDTKNGSR